MIHVTCRLTAKNRDQLRNPTLGNRVWATITFFTSKEKERKGRGREREGRGKKGPKGRGRKGEKGEEVEGEGVDTV